MKKLLPILFLIAHISSVFAQKDVPYLTGRINDEAGVLSSSTIESLDNLLRAHEDSTSNQIAVLVIPSLDGEILEEYSIKVAETWQLGQKEKDNGVLLLVAINDRKMRIEVGYGLEGDLTDALSSRIIRNEIAPSFRQENYDAGITNGVQAILAAIEGSYVAEDDITYAGDDMADIPWFVRLIVGVVFLLVIGAFTFFAFMSKGCASWFLFVFLLPFYGTFPFFIFGPIIAGVLILCYFFGFLYFKFFYIRSGTGKKWFDAKSKQWAASSSGSSGSGWSSGGGSSFSGGGGSFGGGGASGSW